MIGIHLPPKIFLSALLCGVLAACATVPRPDIRREGAVECGRQDVVPDQPDPRPLQSLLAQQGDRGRAEVCRGADVVDGNEIGPVFARIGQERWRAVDREQEERVAHALVDV